MKQMLFRWVMGLLRPAFERLRLYFGSPTLVALEQLRQEVRDARLSIQQAAHFKADAAVGSSTTPPYQPKDAALVYVQAGTMQAMFEQWLLHRDVLKNCALVVACPLTANAARALLQPAEMVIVAGPQDWPQALAGRRWDTIALVGLNLMQQALQSPQVPYYLIRACRRELLYLAQPVDDAVKQRRALHQVGFYEVACVSTDGQSDYFTTGWSVHGEFMLRGSQPGLSWPGGEWCLHRASRGGQPEGFTTTRWKSVLGDGLQPSTLGWTGYPDSLSLSICESEGSNATATDFEQRVQAVMQWPLYGGAGHASLVGAYHGPSDSKMVLAMIQLDSSGAAGLSLWWNDNQWRCLSSAAIPAQECQILAKSVRLPCWLHLTATRLRAGCGSHALIEASVADRLSSTTTGLRIYGQHIAVTDFESHIGEGHG